MLVVKNPSANGGDVRDAGSIPGLSIQHIISLACMYKYEYEHAKSVWVLSDSLCLSGL